MDLRKAVRTAQTYAGPFVEVKAWAQQRLRKALHKPSEACYAAFELLPYLADTQYLDIGANRGQTISSIRLYKQRTPIIAFEPNPIMAHRLASRYKADNDICIHPYGLGDEPGHFDLYIPYYRGFMFDGLASFDWRSAHDWLNSASIYGFQEKKLNIEQVRCEIRIWDDIDTRPGVVKIDVQGFELNVLRGGIETIRKHRPIFIIENDPLLGHENFLFNEGYRRASYFCGKMLLDDFGLRNTFYLPEESAYRIQQAFKPLD